MRLNSITTFSGHQINLSKPRGSSIQLKTTLILGLKYHTVMIQLINYVLIMIRLPDWAISDASFCLYKINLILVQFQGKIVWVMAIITCSIISFQFQIFTKEFLYSSKSFKLLFYLIIWHLFVNKWLKDYKFNPFSRNYLSLIIMRIILMQLHLTCSWHLSNSIIVSADQH